MSITDELRDYAEAYGEESRINSELNTIADRIDAEHERAVQEKSIRVYTYDEDMEHDGWVRLPKDSDGGVIYVGDELDGYGKTIEVVELRIGNSGWVIVSRDGNAYADVYAFTHHHASTVEDVLREFALDIDPSADVDISGKPIIERFAAKLQLRGDGECS